MENLHTYGCDILTIGQYLQPTSNHLAVEKFYSPEEQPPIYLLVREVHPDFEPMEFPILRFTDSSWQDCVDTSSSTGAYVAYMHGSFVDGSSFVPVPITLSSSESKYNAAVFAITAAIHLKQVYNSLSDNNPGNNPAANTLTSAKTFVQCQHR